MAWAVSALAVAAVAGLVFGVVLPGRTATQQVVAGPPSSIPQTLPQKEYQPSPPVTADTVLSVDVSPDGQTWLAVRAPCPTGWCINLAHSVPGTEGFTPLESTTVPASDQTSAIRLGDSDCDTADCGAIEVLFANRDDGYLFDPGLYMTVDGGATWRQVPGGTVNALVLSGTQVLRGVFSHAGCPGPCDEELQTSNPGTTSWKNLPTPPQFNWAGKGVMIASSGTGTDYALSPTNQAQGIRHLPSRIYRLSSDAQTWTPLPVPCPANTDVEAMAASGSRLAVICNGYSATQVAVSDDDGTAFAPAHPVPVADTGLIALGPNELYIATGQSGGEGTGAFAVARSSDNGASWTQVLSGTDQLNSTLTYNTVLAVDPQGPVYFVADPRSVWVSPEGTTWTSVLAGHL